jgi:hypothetical protein
MILVKTFAFLAGACCLCGCAHVEVAHVSAHDRSNGIHYNEPVPFLWVTDVVTPAAPATPAAGTTPAMPATPKKDTITGTIIYLPDQSQRYVVRVRPGWGTVNGSVKLDNGWMLDTLGAQSDSKGPETITAVTGLLAGAAALAPRMVGAPAPPAPGLYRIAMDTNNNVRLVPQPGWKFP